MSTEETIGGCTMNGKGSSPRPLSVGLKEFADNWDLVFSSGDKHEDTEPGVVIRGDDKIDTGREADTDGVVDYPEFIESSFS